MRSLHILRGESRLQRPFRLVPGFLTVAAVAALIVLLVTRPVRAGDPPFFDPAAIETFDGKSWSGLTLGVTTQDGVKKQFRNSRGDYGSSVLLEMNKQKDQRFHVTALYPTKDKAAPLQGICIRYTDAFHGLPLNKLQAALGGAGSAYFSTTRYEDWAVVAYPERGVLLFALGNEVPMVLLGSPRRIAPTVGRMSTNAMPLGVYGEQFRFAARLLRYENVGVSFSLTKIKWSDENRARRHLTEDAQAAYTGGGVLRYDPRATTGRYDISIDARYNPDKGGSGTATVSISGVGPFGNLSTTRSADFSIDRGPDDRSLEETDCVRAAQRAMRLAERDLALQVLNQQPPPIQSARLADWDRVIDTYRYHATDASDKLLK